MKVKLIKWSCNPLNRDCSLHFWGRTLTFVRLIRSESKDSVSCLQRHSTPREKGPCTLKALRAACIQTGNLLSWEECYSDVKQEKRYPRNQDSSLVSLFCYKTETGINLWSGGTCECLPFCMAAAISAVLTGHLWNSWFCRVCTSRFWRKWDLEQSAKLLLNSCCFLRTKGRFWTKRNEEEKTSILCWDN